MKLSTSTHRFAVLGATTVIAAALLTGCSTGDGATGGGDDQIVVGYSGYNVSNPFFAGLLKGLDNGAEAQGYKLITTNANGDPSQQVTDVQNLITQGADYIAINPADGSAIAPAVSAATAAGIPVIALADSITADVTFTIAPDQVEAGKQAAEHMVEFLTDRYGAPEGKIVNIQGLAGTAAASLRDEGFMSVISTYPDIEVVATQDGGWDTAPSNAVMTPILEANPEIDAVFGANDAEAIGISAAIDAAGRFVPVGEDGHIYVIGVDGPKPAIDAIRKGVQDATVSQNPVAMAEKMVELIADLEADKTVEADVVWPVQYIDLENIESPEVTEYGIWADQV
jgi:ribose transport system substrate-binding protein